MILINNVQSVNMDIRIMMESVMSILIVAIAVVHITIKAHAQDVLQDSITMILIAKEIRSMDVSIKKIINV